MEKKDKTIVCKDCKQEFVFTVGEQEFFESRGLTHDPVRCKACRDKKRNASRPAFNKDGNNSDNRRNN